MGKERIKKLGWGEMGINGKGAEWDRGEMEKGRNGKGAKWERDELGGGRMGRGEMGIDWGRNGKGRSGKGRNGNKPSLVTVPLQQRGQVDNHQALEFMILSAFSVRRLSI